ncbi:MAG: hypothetical protein HOF33_18885 [Rhodospirillaceae bacterium]|nr:hypothetical protein [Rhodospirillaceae bacterium]
MNTEKKKLVLANAACLPLKRQSEPPIAPLQSHREDQQQGLHAQTSMKETHGYAFDLEAGQFWWLVL